MEINMIYVPCPDQASAETLVKALLEKRFIACGNIFHSSSMYLWEGVLTSEKECVAVMKTTSGKVSIALEEISKLHSYDLPAILTWQVSSNEAYAKWVKDQVESII